MYCVQCGHKLSDEARFCGACGAPVTGESVTVSQMASVNEVAASPEGTRVTFAAAMDSAKKRSRRHIPVPILVVLVALLMSSVAFASYLVYTNVIAPPEEPALQEEVIEEISPWDKAVEQYQVVLDQYRQFDVEFPYGMWSGNYTDADYEEIDAKYPYVNIGYDGYETDYQIKHAYSYYDMDEDEIPELIVFHLDPYTDFGSMDDAVDFKVPNSTTEMKGCPVAGIYSVSNGLIETVDTSQIIRGALLFYGPYVLRYLSGGVYVWGHDVMSFEDHQYTRIASILSDGSGEYTGEVEKMLDGVTMTEPYNYYTYGDIHDEFLAPYTNSPIKDMEVFPLQ